MSASLLSVLLGVCGMFGWGVYDYLGGALAKRMGSFVPLLSSQAFGAAAIGLVALVARTSWDLSVGSVLLVPVAAGLYCGGYLFFFRGFEKGSVSVVAATMNLWAVVTMVVAYLFAGQRLTPTQTVGAAAIIAGASLASIDWSQVRRHGLRATAGVKETLVGAVLFGVYWNISEVISEDLDWLRTTVLIKLAVVTVLLGVGLAAGLLGPRGPRGVRPARAPVGTFVVLAGMGVVEVSAVSAVNYGLTVGDAILITPIASALSVVTIALAVVLLRERVSLPQAAGMALAVTGIITTAL